MNNLTKLPWNPDIRILLSVSAESDKSGTNLCLAGEEKSVGSNHQEDRKTEGSKNEVSTFVRTTLTSLICLRPQ